MFGKIVNVTVEIPFKEFVEKYELDTNIKCYDCYYTIMNGIVHIYICVNRKMVLIKEIEEEKIIEDIGLDVNNSYHIDEMSFETEKVSVCIYER